MKLEKQILSIKQAQHLQELGLNMSDAAYCHIYELVPKCINGEYCEAKEWNIKPYNKYLLSVQPDVILIIPTYTLQEVLDKLPRYFGSLKLDIKNFSICYRSSTTGKMVRGYRSFALDGLFNGAYKLLCWVLENGFKEDEK